MIKQQNIRNPYHSESAVYQALNSLKNLYGSHDINTVRTVANEYDRNLGSNLISEIESWYK